MLMLLVLCFSFVPHVQAAEEVTQKHILQVKRVEGEKETDENLLVLRIGDTWYAEQESLAELVGCKATYNENTGIIGFVRQSPSIILCTFKEEECVRRSDNWYVPLQEATCETGLEFYIREGQIKVYVRRTPQDLKNLLFELFRVEKLYLMNTMILFDEWEWIAQESAARGYALLSQLIPFKISPILNELLGVADERRYEEAIGEILSTDGETAELFTNMATADKFIKSRTEDAELLYFFLARDKTDTPFSSVYKEIASVVGAENLEGVECLGDMAAILDEYKKIKKEVPISEALKVMKFWELAMNADTYLLKVMNVVVDSDNGYAVKALYNITITQQGGKNAGNLYARNAYERFGAFYTDKAIKESIELLDEGYSVESAIGKVIVEYLFNRIMRLDKKSDFIIYLPIFSTLQHDTARYYFDNSDGDHVNWTILRACGIIYAKTAMAAAEKLAFDKSMEDAVDSMKTTAKYYLKALLEYSDQEYSPSYTNEELIAYLQTTYPKEQEVAARWRNAEELVAEHRYWSWTVGVTTAGHYYVELHEDNSARLICSSAISYADKEVIGGYEEPVGWSYADGVLTICGIDHYWNGEEFLTEELYEMQSPTIQRPLRFSPAVNAEECAEYFRFVYNDTTSAPTSVPTTPTPDVAPSQDQEAANRWKYAEDLLEEYEYWDWQRGYNAESWFPVKLYRDGTAESIEYVPPRERIDDSEWWYADGVLHIFGDEYHWNGNCFESSGEYETSEGSYLTYYLHPDTDGNVAAEFERAYRSINGSQETSTTAPTETWNPSINDMLEVGDYIPFGTYEQDNDLYNGPEDLPWIVLDKIGDEVLLISRFVLDCDVYHSEKDTSVQWSNSELRYWLNNTFYQQTFSEEEKAKIIEKEVRAESNPDYGTYAGANTRDKVTLLSISEAKKYFPSNSDRACKATEYAIAQGVQVDNNGNSWWWLRTPGQLDGYAAGVFRNGEVDPIGDIFYHEGDGIRPVIWVNFDKEVDADGDATYTVDAYPKDTSAEDLSTLSAEELEWFTEAYPYNDEGYIELMDEDGAPYSCADFTGYIIPWTAQYSEDHCCVLVRIMSAVEILESQYSSDYAKGLKVGDTIQLDELGPITIERIDWQNEICTINDLYTLSYKPDEDVYVFRMSRTTLTRYGERGMLAWIPVGEYTNFIESGGQDFDPETDSYRRYIETYGGWKVVFTLYDDRCTWMYESGLAG